MGGYSGSSITAAEVTAAVPSVVQITAGVVVAVPSLAQIIAALPAGVSSFRQPPQFGICTFVNGANSAVATLTHALGTNGNVQLLGWNLDPSIDDTQSVAKQYPAIELTSPTTVTAFLPDSFNATTVYFVAFDPI